MNFSSEFALKMTTLSKIQSWRLTQIHERMNSSRSRNNCSLRSCWTGLILFQGGWFGKLVDARWTDASVVCTNQHYHDGTDDVWCDAVRNLQRCEHEPCTQNGHLIPGDDDVLKPCSQNGHCLAVTLRLDRLDKIKRLTRSSCEWLINLRVVDQASRKMWNQKRTTCK